ncbi:MAG: hypothetical protein PHW10_00790 [Candidatus Peribacteraceae bacterium]|nr:hypothetical protein [Candidatus Peribacteraceae bacterium]
MRFALFLIGLLPQRAFAQLPVLCDGLPGCGGGGDGGEILSSAAIIVIDIIFTTVGAGAVAGIVWGGLQFVMAAGDESRIGKARDTVKNSMLGLALGMAAGSIVTTLITHTPSSGFSPEGVLLAMVTIMLSIFNAAVVVVILIAAVRMAAAGVKSDEFQKGVNAIKWALIGAVIANLGRALAQLVAGILD